MKGLMIKTAIIYSAAPIGGALFAVISESTPVELGIVGGILLTLAVFTRKVTLWEAQMRVMNDRLNRFTKVLAKRPCIKGDQCEFVDDEPNNLMDAGKE